MIKYNYKFVMILLLVSMSSIAHAYIFFDDFSMNPFDSGSARWTSVSVVDYGPMWAYYGWDPALVTNGTALSLPFPTGTDTIYFFSNGTKTLWTTQQTANSTSTYYVWMDFIIKGNSAIDGLVIGQHIQRGTDNTSYSAQFSIGSGGRVKWGGIYPLTSSSTSLGTNTWYTMRTLVDVGASAVSVQSSVLRKSDQAIVSTSTLYSDSSGSRRTMAYGYGFFITLPGSHYWDQSVEIDDIAVDGTYTQLIPPVRVCGDVDTAYLSADIAGADGERDCRVNFLDFAKLALDWLTCSDPAGCS